MQRTGACGGGTRSQLSLASDPRADISSRPTDSVIVSGGSHVLCLLLLASSRGEGDGSESKQEEWVARQRVGFNTNNSQVQVGCPSSVAWRNASMHRVKRTNRTCIRKSSSKKRRFPPHVMRPDIANLVVGDRQMMAW